jgi:glycopeptide antibiotics resistance protein
MPTRNKKQKNLTYILFILYLLVLIWIIVFKFSFSLEDIPTLRSVNLVPLEGTAVRNNQYDYGELLSNVLIFVPFGLYMSMLKPRWRFLAQLLPIAGTSLLFESLQYIFAIGATDITDLIGNTLGGVLGILFCYIFSKIFQTQSTKLLNTIASIGTIAIFALFALLMIVNA